MVLESRGHGIDAHRGDIWTKSGYCVLFKLFWVLLVLTCVFTLVDSKRYIFFRNTVLFPNFVRLLD